MRLPISASIAPRASASCTRCLRCCPRGHVAYVAPDDRQRNPTRSRQKDPHRLIAASSGLLVGHGSAVLRRRRSIAPLSSRASSAMGSGAVNIVFLHRVSRVEHVLGLVVAAGWKLPPLGGDVLGRVGRVQEREWRILRAPVVENESLTRPNWPAPSLCDQALTQTISLPETVRTKDLVHQRPHRSCSAFGANVDVDAARGLIRFASAPAVCASSIDTTRPPCPRCRGKLSLR